MKKTSPFVIASVLTAMIMTGCGSNRDGDVEHSPASGTSEQTDESKEVQIGSQMWMAANLNVDRFRNGDPIPNAKTNEEWERAGQEKQPAWCYYDNDPANGRKFGKLYNWYAATDPRGLAPEGWAIPSDEDWNELVRFLGGRQVAGKQMKSKRGWDQNGNGTNESGFSGLPGGARKWAGDFASIGKIGYWWSSTDDGPDTFIWTRTLDYDRDTVFRGTTHMATGLSVRCIRM